MSELSIQKAGGTRYCHQCDRRIIKGSKFVIDYWADGPYQKYLNYCPLCAVKMLKKNIKYEIGMLNSMVKYGKWDS